jgi:hypothetical protein
MTGNVPFPPKGGKKLTLRELEATTCLGTAVLLTFNDARVTGKEAFSLHSRTQSGLILGERLRDAVLDCACLTGKTATLHTGRYGR